MAITISDIDKLQEYLKGVMERANHHAHNVNEISLTLIGALLWKTNGEISVREYKGRTANIINFSIDKKKFCLSFNHLSGDIELKSGNNNGPVLHIFNNTMTNLQVINIFNIL